jgi:hypothetical protein
MKDIVIDGKHFVPRSNVDHAQIDFAQRNEVADKFIAEVQVLIAKGRNAGMINRKIQAARNVLQGVVTEAPVLPAAVATTPVGKAAKLAAKPKPKKRPRK